MIEKIATLVVYGSLAIGLGFCVAFGGLFGFEAAIHVLARMGP